MTDTISRGAHGAWLTAWGQGAKAVIQFVSVVVLSRLLSPDDVGLIAMVMVFVAFGDMLRDMGMTTVGLQRKDLSRQQASNLFWINSGLGAITGVLLAAGAGLLAHLYDDQRLWLVAPALAPALLMNGLTAQLRVQLARGMRWRALVAADVLPQLLSLGITAVLALSGFEYWSIVVGTLAAAVSSFGISWLTARWRPLLPRPSGESTRLVQDGAAFGLAQFLTFLSSNVDTLIIGIRWDSVSVGLYSRSYQLLTMPVSRLMAPLTQVVIPTTNAATSDGRTVDSVLLRLQSALGFVIVAVFAVSGAGAEWLIPLLLGEQWRGVVPLFQAMAAGGVFWVMSFVSYWRFILENQGLQLVYYNLVSKLLTVAAILAASFFSMEAIAWAVAASLAISWPINLIWLRRSAGQPIRPYLVNGLGLIAPGLTALALGAWGVHALGGSGWDAIATTLASGVFYAAVVMIIPGQRTAIRKTLATLIRAVRSR